MTAAKTRYEVGIKKLLGAAADVSVMQKNLADLKPKLVKAAADVQTIVGKVARETADAAKVEAVVVEDEIAAGEQVHW